jgi:hypothetical protein
MINDDIIAIKKTFSTPSGIIAKNLFFLVPMPMELPVRVVITIFLWF